MSGTSPAPRVRLNTMSSIPRALGALLLIAATACVDAPTGDASAATADDPLAQAFDELARQATASGDAARAEGFTYAAIAARNGVTPSRLDVINGSTSEIYEAFVNSVDWQVAGSAVTALRVPAHRVLTAWRRTTDGVTRVLTFSTPSDSSAVVNPAGFSVTTPVSANFAGAAALYQETTTVGTLGSSAVNAPVVDEFWIGTAGWVKLRELSVGAACPRQASSREITGVACRNARFQVRMDVTMQRLNRRPFDVMGTSPARRFRWTADQALAGYKLTFACQALSASKGCG